MTHKQSLGNRITSAFLAIAILFTMIPLTARAASAASLDNSRIADPSTMDSWKDFFPITGEISTENAGGVWMDKSVFANASAFNGLGIAQDDPNSFLVALSAMAANMSVTGMSHVPTDSILVLDVSGSMNDDQGNNDVAEELVQSANASIKALLETNSYNRVGVVLYSGSSGSSTNYTTAAVVLLPLNRYTTGSDGQYLNYTRTSGWGSTETISLDADLRIEGTNTAPASVSKEVVGATYMQRGIITAMNQFLADDNEVVVDGWQRTPVLVLMSDGAPSLGSTNFMDPGYDENRGYNLGTGAGTSAALGFVSQLSAAYAKMQIEKKYGTDALFYTLGLGLSNNDSVAIGVLEPDNKSASTALSDFWTAYNAPGATSVTVQSGGRGQSAKVVSVIDTPLEQNYVDQYFDASGSSGDLAAELAQAFKDIVGAIQLQSSYYPTLVSESEDLSGYISFVDKVGQYMEVTDIKGILINNQLFSGANLASNFVSSGGALGTYDNPSALGIEMVAAVRARFGLESDEVAATLIQLAYENGQLSYTDANNFSNYIGWYANAAGEFLGFYNEGTTVLPEATGNAATDPVFTIRSYGYLGAVDASHGVSESDMMYATVQVRKEIATGEELVTFAVPAALIPIVTYNVTLDENGSLSNLTVSGAENPIRLVYEVALDDKINSFNVKQIMSAEYLGENMNADGTINFYTNQWDHENKTGYGTVNTYSYFNPSRQNDKYYYLSDAPVYTDTNGTRYTGSAQPSADGTFYRSYVVYKNNGSLRAETVYRELSDAAKATALQAQDGTWYIPEGNVHVNLDGYTIHKSENLTGTISESNIPFVDTQNHSIDDTGYQFYVGATHGNNGKMTVTPETGIKLTKAMADGVADPGTAFAFDIENTSDANDNGVYTAWLVSADGTEQTARVTFENGVATVELKAGDILYIGGMTSGHTFRITERETAEYVATASGLSAAGTVTVNQYNMQAVTFVNDERGTGHLTIAKEVKHDFGVDYQIPSDKVFTMKVELNGIGTKGVRFAAIHTGDPSVQFVEPDETGNFTVQLKHDEKIEIFDLPAGTVATVVEMDPAVGFTPAYWDNGEIGDGAVTVMDNNTVSVIVVNDYQAAAVSPVNLNLSGTKYVKDASGAIVEWNDSYEFEIVLERYGANGWEKVDSKILTKGNQSFTFDMSGEIYDAPGVYSYQVYEVEPAAGEADRIDGMIYDIVWHTFSVYVSDADMDGKLEIVRVHSDHANKDFEPVENTYNIVVDFNNVQTVTVPALAIIEIQKILTNASGSTNVSLAGYTFGLYNDYACTEPAVLTDSITAISINPTDSVGEGWIDIQIRQQGSYMFYVKELAGGINNMTYSDKVIGVKIDVTAHPTEANALVAEVTYYDGVINGTEYDPGEDGKIEFTNIYDPKDVSFNIDFVGKEISGRDMTAGDNFTFEVRTQDGATVLTGSNNGTKTVTFNRALTFDKVGTYYYNIVETGADGNGITLDKTIYRIVVTVADNNGQLEASYSIINAVGSMITFVNKYAAASVDHSIEGTKTLRGRTLINDEFNFVLTELTVDGVTVQNPRSWNTKNLSDGSIHFPVITYDKAGTYVYSVEEVRPEGDKAYGIAYDATVYKVTVVVIDNGKGAYEIESETVALLNNTAASALSFVNEYEANPTWTQFIGNKTLTGKVNNALQGGEFEFVLYNADANWVQGGEREKVENGAGGVITFNRIDFSTDADQYFLVKEVNGGQTIEGITYDDTVYRVWVEVTDDLKGQLHATVHIYDGDGIPRDSISFLNIYEVTGGAEVTLSGEKIINGRDWKSGDSFTFELFEADETYNANGEAVKTATVNSADHNYSITLNYTPQDIGKTYYYVLKENGTNPIKGLTYSRGEYKIKVLVEDDNMGGVKTTVTVENATASTLNFVNEYSVTAGTFVQFEATKALEGKDLGNIQFSFDLIESNANWESVKVLQSKENRGADIDFEKIEYMAAGDYYYIIAEQKAGQTISGISYDDVIYRIHVKVSDHLDGSLSKNVTITKVDGDTSAVVETIAFVNTYSVTGTDTVELSGTKTFEGRDWTEGDTFVIELYSANADFDNLSADPVAAATVDRATGRFIITQSYDVNDLGQTFYYVVKEKNAGQKIDGISYSDVSYNVTVTVKDNGDGAVDAIATVEGAANNALNFTNSYLADNATVTFAGTKSLETKSGIRELKANDFTFDLYETNENFVIDGDAIQSVKNDENGAFTFKAEDLTEAKTYYYVVKENSQNPIGGVVYDSTLYYITVTVTDNGSGNLTVSSTAIVKVNGETAKPVESIEFVNTYNAAVANVTIEGSKILSGRELVDGEFKFLLIAADEAFNALDDAAAMVARNAGGKFTFDALCFTEAGIYYFIVSEDTAVNAERVSFDDTVYFVTIEVTDDESGQLVASDPVIVKKGSTDTVEAIEFTNVYVPKPADITVDIMIHKTVVNRGTDTIGPGDFAFLLEDLGDEVDGLTVKSDENGEAKFILTFTEADIGKTYTYKLTEVNSGRANVTYSTAEYTITIAISLNEETNTLEAAMTMDDIVATELAAAFENIYDYTPAPETPPQTGDTTNGVMWIALMLISGGAAITLCVADKKNRRQAKA